MSNVYDEFAAVAARFPQRPAVEVCRRAGLETMTYAELRRLADRVAGVIALRAGTSGTRCALLADNDARWCATYLGVLRLGAVAVPLDTAYKPSQVRTVLRDSGASVIFTTARYLATAREAMAGLTPPPHLVLASGAEAGVTSLDGAHDSGPEPDMPPCPATAADAAVILYTSGTTSDPKGVVLTHGNLLAERTGALQVVTLTEEDRVLGVLPLFHALAQVANLLLPLTVGARVVFLETLNSAEMMQALVERRITAFCVVPQFYYLLHQRVMERVKASSLPVRATFGALLRLNGWLRQGLRVNLGRVLFRQVHGALGGRMRLMVTGGSRFDPRIGRDLFRMGLNIIQAYGLTECCGAATVTRPGDAHIETVGLPFAGVEVRVFEDAADARHRDHPDGEVLIKGPIVMAGYHNRPDATAEAIQDGWLHTGDLGYFDRAGRLQITGRKKEVIVLASGKNIYPEEIEAQYLHSPYIKEICVLGVALPDEPSAERLHAIVVPDLDLMRERRIVNTREIIRFDIEGLSLHLPHHKRVLSFDIWQESLPLTTTRKLKRHEIERLYRERLAGSHAAADAVEWRDEDQVWAADPHVERALAAIRAAAKPGSALAPDANLELDLGLDSMERVELLASLEAAFSVDVPEDAAQRIYTVRELVEVLRPGRDPGSRASDSAVEPWTRILSQDSDDPVLTSIVRPKRLVQVLAFAVMKGVYGLAWLLMGLRVSGREKIPADGPFLISPNHQSYLDAFLVVGALPFRTFRRLFFVGASEYFATPLTALFARLMNVVPVDPDANLVRAMQAGAFGLRHDKVLVLFPEGERSPDGTMKKYKKGAAILSLQLGAPVVPVAIHGFGRVWPRGKGLRWRTLLPLSGTRTAIQFGDPIRPEIVEPSDGTDRYSSLTDVLRQETLAMWTAFDTRR